MAQSDAGLISGKIRELTRLIRETRLAETIPVASPDGIFEQADTQSHADKTAQKIRAHTKLDALSKALKGVYAEIPKASQIEQDAFTFALLPGTPPRFWVDLTSFVIMTDEGQTYHFMKDTRDGRVSLFQGESLGETANAVADYVAEHIVSQSRLETDETVETGKAGEVEPSHQELDAPTPHIDEPIIVAAIPAEEPRASEGASAPIIIQPAPARTDWVKLFLAFALGVFVGAVILFAVAWFQTPAIS